MGCSKNLVDSEHLLHMFKTVGYRIFHNPKKMHNDIAVINTCGFISDAKQESIDMILYLTKLKQEGKLNKVIVMGCLSERYKKELSEEIAGIDRFYGKFDWKGLVDDLAKETGTQTCSEAEGQRVLTTPKHYAYIKIAEGCNRHCAYCAIPAMTGPHKSRRMEDILDEVATLAAQGTAEFQIIAQELTYYGLDLYKRRAIAELVDKMAQIKGVRWIRLHYAYPNAFPEDLLQVMAKNKNVCRYLDIALQHASDKVLRRMNRNTTRDEQYALIRKIRNQVPGIALRTTFMVGFPGETDEDFKELLDFVKSARFERMGAFVYSEEDGTPASEMFSDDIPDEVKRQRLDTLMSVQQEISEELSAQHIGRTLDVMIDGREGDYYIGRTEFDSPEVDGIVYVTPKEKHRMRRGCIYRVKITDSNEFDLFGMEQ